MRRPVLGMLFGVAACLILVPTFAEGKSEWSKPYESHYLTAYERCWEAFKADCGRNLLDYAWTDNARVPRARVEASTDRMRAWLNPPAPVATSTGYVAPAQVAPVPVASSAAAPSVVQCESGGDYSINTGNGYYGAYQFDSQTWDAYGDPAYGEANEAPPAVQDAAAASVPYDAWPNC